MRYIIYIFIVPKRLFPNSVPPQSLYTGIRGSVYFNFDIKRILFIFFKSTTAL